MGPGADPARCRRPASVPRTRCSARESDGVRTHCRPHSPSVTPSRPPPPTPTGSASCTLYDGATADRAVPGDRTEPGRRGRHGTRARTTRCASWTGSPAWTAPICCRACAVNCWRGWAVTPRQPTSSTAAAANDHNDLERDVLDEQGRYARSDSMTTVRAVLFDYSGTLFRLEEDDSWFAGMRGRRAGRRRSRPGRADAPADRADGTVRRHGRRADRRLASTATWPRTCTARPTCTCCANPAWPTTTPSRSTTCSSTRRPGRRIPTPPTVLAGLHRQGIKTAVVSNIAFDVRPAFASIGVADDVDEFVLSFEVGAVKPQPGDLPDRAVPAGRGRLGRADGRRQRGGRRRGPGASAVRFALVDPLPTDQRPDGLIEALRAHGVAV